MSHERGDGGAPIRPRGAELNPQFAVSVCAALEQKAYLRALTRRVKWEAEDEEEANLVGTSACSLSRILCPAFKMEIVRDLALLRNISLAAFAPPPEPADASALRILRMHPACLSVLMTLRVWILPAY